MIMIKELFKAACGVAACVAMCGALVACGEGTTFSSSPSGGEITFEDLDKETDGEMDFSFKDGVLDVELSSGSVDVAIYDGIENILEDDEFVEQGELLKEATGLQSGSQVRYSDNDGSIIVYVTGHKATGKITISEQK